MLKVVVSDHRILMFFLCDKTQILMEKKEQKKKHRNIIINLY